MAIFGDVIFQWDDSEFICEVTSWITKNGDYLIVGEHDYINIVDISTPAMTTMRDRYAHALETGWEFIVDEYDDTIFYAMGTLGDFVRILDMTDPDNVALRDTVAGLSSIGGPTAMAKVGDYLYFSGCRYVTEWDAIHIVGIADPDNATDEGFFVDTTNLNYTYGIQALSNGYLLVGTLGGFAIYDPNTTPLTPTLVGKCAWEEGTAGGCAKIQVDAEEAYAYCLRGGTKGVEIIDISDPANPVAETHYTGNGDAAYVTTNVKCLIRGDYLFLNVDAIGRRYLSVFDISVRTAPSFLEALDTDTKFTDAWGGMRAGWTLDDVGATVYMGRSDWTTDYGFALVRVDLPIDGVFVELAGIRVQSQAYGIRTDRGRETELGHAPAGVAELTMDNSEGDFSPENAGGAYYPTLDLGISVYIYEVYLGVTYKLFTGQIEKIVPQDVPGGGGAQAFLLCTDGTDDMVDTVVETPLRTTVKGGQLIEDILDDAEAFVGARDIDTGITTFDVAFFSGKPALAQIRIVEDQERGRFYIDVDGDAQFEDRHHRILNHNTSEYDFGTKLRHIAYEWSKRDLYNRIQITGTKYTAAITADEYIWGTEAGVAATAVVVPANGSITIWAISQDVIESYVTPLVQGTHWNTNTEVDKSGTDTSDSVTVAETQYGKVIKLVFTSTYNADSYLVVPDAPPAGSEAARTAIIMGKTYTEDVIQHVETYAASIAAYRKKGMSLAVPFLGDPDELRTLATFIGDRHKDPQPMAIRVTIHARTDWPTDDILKQALTRKISDRVTLASTLLGFDQDFYIEKVIHDYKLFQGKFNLDVIWVCSRASVQDSLTWLLEIAGFGELGETTYLSY